MPKGHPEPNRTREDKLRAQRESGKRYRATLSPREILAYSLRQFYGMAIEQYDAMREAQGYSCAVCGTHESECRFPNQKKGQSGRLTVDHNHITGEVRGLLCLRCNAALGNTREETGIMHALIAYIEQYPGPYGKERSSRSATHKSVPEHPTLLGIIA